MRRFIVPLLLLGLSSPVWAASPEGEGFEIGYQSYDGGGKSVNGPALLVRKDVADQYAVTFGYQLEMIDDASVDVVTAASPYSENRHQFDLGFDHQTGKLSYGLGLSYSLEDDYKSTTASFGVGQDLFNDLTRLSFSFALGWDDVSRNGIPSFSAEVDRRVYSFDIRQILSPRLVTGLSWQTITESGFLSNPYRVVRYRDATSPRGYSYQAEVYPGTRTGNAVALRADYHFPYRLALHGEYRFYSDDWDIRAHTFELGYTHGFGEGWTFEAHYRYHTQDGADFYSDLFPTQDYQTYMSRNRDFSTMSSQTIGVGLGYEFPTPRLGFVQRGAVSLRYDIILSDYDEYRDLRFTEAQVGREPLYSFDANVIQLYLSGWF